MADLLPSIFILCFGLTLGMILIPKFLRISPFFAVTYLYAVLVAMLVYWPPSVAAKIATMSPWLSTLGPWMFCSSVLMLFVTAALGFWHVYDTYKTQRSEHQD